MNLSPRTRLVLFATMILSGQLVLIWATGIIEAAGGTVPDLMPIIPLNAEVHAAFDQLTRIDPVMYLTVLWTADILFPVGYGGFLNTLLKPLGPIASIPLCAMAMDFAENIFATLIILVGQYDGFMAGFSIVHTMKFFLISISVGALAFTLLRKWLTRAA